MATIFAGDGHVCMGVNLLGSKVTSPAAPCVLKAGRRIMEQDNPAAFSGHVAPTIPPPPLPLNGVP